MKIAYFASSLVLVPLAALAQTSATVSPPPPPAASEDQGAKRVTFEEDFSDPDDLTAKSLAREEGISLGEAQRRLRLMVNASRTARALRSDPAFIGMRIVNGPDFHVEAVFKGSDQAAAAALTRANVPQELRAAARARGAPFSRAETRGSADNVLAQLRRSNVDADTAFDPLTGRIKVLARDPAKVRAEVGAGRIKLPADAEIEQFSGIICGRPFGCKRYLEVLTRSRMLPSVRPVMQR